MKKIGFLGCGKIGQTLLRHVKEKEYGKVIFIEDPKVELPQEPVVRTPREELYQETDLVIECCTADVLKEHIELILKHADLLMFSVTAFSDEIFENQVRELCEKYGRKVYIPHGAILGTDGIFDGKAVWNSVEIVTTKSPESLGRTDTERTIVYEGTAREACGMYPRNVNVHAAIALAGIGFERTKSKIISDPAVSTNAHEIYLIGNGIEISMHVESFAAGAITGAYTPYSACGSLDRICGLKSGVQFV